MRKAERDHEDNEVDEEEDKEQEAHGLEEGLLAASREAAAPGESRLPSGRAHVPPRAAFAFVTSRRTVRKILVAAWMFGMAEIGLLLVPYGISHPSPFCTGAEFVCPAAVNALMILFTTALMTSIMSCIWTIQGWSILSRMIRILGLLPIITFVLVFAVFVIYDDARQHKDYSCHGDANDCPKTKPPSHDFYGRNEE